MDNELIILFKIKYVTLIESPENYVIGRLTRFFLDCMWKSQFYSINSPIPYRNISISSLVQSTTVEGTLLP